ncbi:MAG: ADP-forming succinate--CoA ligase subunit beta [candidate division WOR-3 bacterium]|nr:ADP-forming succinate--CoA ligase subunit beta [candidate division WOR-3 bacterium]MDW7988360.1 ADP-forming succinate--CoA ligase subunit beta [candidate division WOR-3 bacterium]
MKIHEYQAKEFFRKYNIPTPKEKLITNLDEVDLALSELNFPIVAKAQVLVGGRGKAGGVQFCQTPEELKEAVKRILSMTIKNLAVKKLLLAEAVKYEKEFYLGITIDRERRAPVLIASAAGGMDIEEIALRHPEQIVITELSPFLRLKSYKAREVGNVLFSDKELVNKFIEIAAKLTNIFFDYECNLVEINPLVLADRELVAVDAKIVFDDNGLYRHPELEALRDLDAEEKSELLAKQADLSYVKLTGNVGCIVNGAGLAMATMDLIKKYGAEPANFLDIGGSSSPQKMREAMRIILMDKNVRGILVNIFGGITRCDDVAQGLLWALKEEEIKVPIVARLTGTNELEARMLLENSPIVFARTMTEGVKKIVELTRS